MSIIKAEHDQTLESIYPKPDDYKGHFEKWAKVEAKWVSLKKNEIGRYCDFDTEQLWRAWTASHNYHQSKGGQS